MLATITDVTGLESSRGRARRCSSCGRQHRRDDRRRSPREAGRSRTRSPAWPRGSRAASATSCGKRATRRSALSAAARRRSSSRCTRPAQVAAHRRRRPRRPEAERARRSCSTTGDRPRPAAGHGHRGALPARPTSSSTAIRPTRRAVSPSARTTHVVIVTHGHVHDPVALRSVIGSPAASIGMIGSANKVRKVFAQLREEGVTREQLEAGPLRRSVWTSAPRLRPSWPCASWPRSWPTASGKLDRGRGCAAGGRAAGASPRRP